MQKKLIIRMILVLMPLLSGLSVISFSSSARSNEPAPAAKECCRKSQAECIEKEPMPEMYGGSQFFPGA